jgi:hypothetical protein
MVSPLKQKDPFGSWRVRRPNFPETALSQACLDNCSDPAVNVNQAALPEYQTGRHALINLRKLADRIHIRTYLKIKIRVPGKA